jgi:ferredoxin
MLQALKSFASLFKPEKVQYVQYDRTLCVHVQDGKVTCTLCIDACPRGGITSVGNEIQFNPSVCAACGGCAKACPTGAIKFARTFPE